jgi:hypothetical protein
VPLKVAQFSLAKFFEFRYILPGYAAGPLQHGGQYRPPIERIWHLNEAEILTEWMRISSWCLIEPENLSPLLQVWPDRLHPSPAALMTSRIFPARFGIEIPNPKEEQNENRVKDGLLDEFGHSPFSERCFCSGGQKGM